MKFGLGSVRLQKSGFVTSFILNNVLFGLYEENIFLQFAKCRVENFLLYDL